MPPPNVLFSPRGSLNRSSVCELLADGKMVKMTGFMGFSYCIVYAMNTALRIVDLILDLLSGYTIRHGSLNERIRSESYECSAQLVDILAWGAHSYVLIQPNNYVWRHKRYVHPRYVLEHDNITLMGITPTHAFFCVSDSKVDVRNIKVSVCTKFAINLQMIFLTRHCRKNLF